MRNQSLYSTPNHTDKDVYKYTFLYVLIRVVSEKTSVLRIKKCVEIKKRIIQKLREPESYNIDRA